MYIPPWTILAGLGALSRSDLCGHLASFEETKLSNLAFDRALDIKARILGQQETVSNETFLRRLAESAERLVASDAPDAALRLRLWDHLNSALHSGASLPLSTRIANARCAELADAAVRALPNTGPARTGVSRLVPVFTKQDADFSAVVADYAGSVTQAAASMAKAGHLSEEAKNELVQRVRQHIDGLPRELRTSAMDEALESGDRAILRLLASGTSLIGVGMAVQLAGFSAYIMAAQAAAFIPLISGPALVSILFVLANPLFIVPAIVGGSYLARRHLDIGSARGLAATMVVQLALKGAEVEREGLRTSIDGFRTLARQNLASLPASHQHAVSVKLGSVRAQLGTSLPSMPASPQGFLAQSVDNSRSGGLHRLLFPKSDGSTREAAVVGGLTAADILFDAAAIDPTVLEAADFSRSDDISGIMDFAAFADRISAFPGSSLIGAESNLRGYVAEQIVAARLVEQGHVVSFPATANNPGSYLLVDGQAFQVKCLSYIGGLRDHFSKYPDIPAFANAELSEAIMQTGEAWANMVYYVEGFDLETTEAIMQRSLEAGGSLGDLNIPYFAIAVSGARNLHGWWKGRIPLSDLPAHVVIDGAMKGSLSAAGGLSGKVLGLLLFGPAGALVLGGIGGAGALMGSNWTRQQITSLFSREWLENLDEATDRYRIALVRQIRRKIRLLQMKQTEVAQQKSEHTSWVSARLADDIVALAEHAHELEFETPQLAQPERARTCLEAMSTAAVHPSAVQMQLSELLRVLDEQPSLPKAASGKARTAWNQVLSQVHRSG